MPQFKQPATLESLVLQSIQKLIYDLGQKLLAEVCSGTPASVLPTAWGMPSYLKSPVGENHFDYKLDGLQPFLHPGLPLHLTDAVITAMLDTINTIISQAKCTCDGFSKSGDDSCKAVIENLISVALHGEISHLDLSQWPWLIGEVLLKHLYKFQHLEMLKLWPRSWSPMWLNLTNMLETGVCSFRTLISFSMRCHCTDRILHAMVNSTRLQYLDVMSSVEVTDNCVNSLLQLKKLKIVNIFSTSITASGYAALLIGLPKLSKLVWFDKDGQAIESIQSSPLGLLSYETSRISINNLNIVVLKCPYLTQISLHWVETDLSVLTELKYLRELKLSQCSATEINLSGLLQVIGYNILSLELQEVSDVNLLTIGLFCVNLKRMTLVCGFQAIEQSFIGLHTHIFRKLKELRFGSPQYSEYLFFNCVNIQKLEIFKCQNFSDQVILTLLMKNPLKQLKLLSISDCGHLSLNTVHLLLASCDNLEVLQGLHSWGGVNKQEVTELCVELKKKNFDIEILWKRPINILW